MEHGQVEICPGSRGAAVLTTGGLDVDARRGAASVSSRGSAQRRSSSPTSSSAPTRSSRQQQYGVKDGTGKFWSHFRPAVHGTQRYQRQEALESEPIHMLGKAVRWVNASWSVQKRHLKFSVVVASIRPHSDMTYLT